MPDPLSHRDRVILFATLHSLPDLLNLSSPLAEQLETLAIEALAHKAHALEEKVLPLVAKLGGPVLLSYELVDMLVRTAVLHAPYIANDKRFTPEARERLVELACTKLVESLSPSGDVGAQRLPLVVRDAVLAAYQSVADELAAPPEQVPYETSPESADEGPVSLPTIAVHLGDWAELIAVASDFTFFGKPANVLATGIDDLGMPELPGPGLWAWADAGSTPVVDYELELVEDIDWRGQWRRLTPEELSAFAEGTQS